ncbi:hypothetical protein C2869_04370 [Saccharobesus litoralis]|uniref:GIY-YIG domain-containing protein n=1 Tax=Saccharobesus litoralis TaxID=2172099 RepID=A0A2S0VNB7_9ALTE|nr:GIY-YIG nuclease family protein [Saccharobesus litoralis]AWB65721.1 hypothetical protein C2869_04370 [Saccharobesus litoralis]
MKDYYVYILLCNDGSYYTGMTSNMDARLWQHNNAYFPECYTASRLPLKLVYQTTFSDKYQAFDFEHRIKGWSRKKKQALISVDWNALSKVNN